MIKVILNGCSGRMGTVLTDLIATIDDMQVVAGIDVMKTEREYPIFSTLESCKKEADVLIDYSTAVSLKAYLPVAIERKLPIVVATTGLGADALTLLDQAAHKIAVFRSGNMSLGINLMQQLLQTTTKTLKDGFDIEIIEKHHRYKIDAPSGTALMLAESINAARNHSLRNVCGREGVDALRQHDEIGIHALRGGTIVGDHEVFFAGQDEIISIRHQAFSRQVFATGSVAAARYIVQQNHGLYSMQDMIDEAGGAPTLSTTDDEVLISLTHIPQGSTTMRNLYRAFTENEIPMDMISQTGGPKTSISLSFTIPSRESQKAEHLLTTIMANDTRMSLEIGDNLTRHTMTFPILPDHAEVTSRILTRLAQEDIPVLALSTMNNQISLLVSSPFASRVTARLKAELGIV